MQKRGKGGVTGCNGWQCGVRVLCEVAHLFGEGAHDAVQARAVVAVDAGI